MRLRIFLLHIMVAAFVCVTEVVAQSRTFTLQGKVSDEDNNPLELATVAVVNQQKVTFTNLKG